MRRMVSLLLGLVLMAPLAVPTTMAAASRPPGGGENPDFAVYASDHLVLDAGARVRGGAVGVTSSLRTGEAPEFRVEIQGARVDGDVYGDSVRLGPGSQVRNVYTNRLVETRAKRGMVFPLRVELPLVPAVNRSAPGVDEFRVAERRREILRGPHTRVEVGAGGTLVLPGGRVDLESLDLGDRSRLEVERQTVLAIGRRLNIGRQVFVGPADSHVAMNLTVLVAGDNGPAPVVVRIGERAQVHALLLAPRGGVRLAEGARLQGGVLAQSVELGRGSDVVYHPGLTSFGSDLQCVFPVCDAVAGGTIECHSAPMVGLACSDGSVCTSDDACNERGQCVGQPIASPDPEKTNPCVRDVCDPEKGYYEPEAKVCATGLTGCVSTLTCNGLGSCIVPWEDAPDGSACEAGGPGGEAGQCLTGVCVSGGDCRANACGGDPSNPDSPADLDCWLNTHPQLRDEILWNWSDLGSFGWFRYWQWSDAQRQELRNAFAAAWQWLANGRTSFQGTPVPEPAPNEKALGDLDYPRTYLSEANARALYFARVGHILALEIRGDVPWSLCDDLGQTDATLNAQVLYSFSTLDGTPSGVPVYRVRTEVTPAHPTVLYSFLVDNDLIGATRVETINRLIDWSRRLWHFHGDVQVKVMEEHWQYRGAPPVSRTIAGTVSTHYPNNPTFAHWTRGCWGTSGFLKDVLGSVNIPVTEKSVPEPSCQHATPYFPTEKAYLSHGDDPYGPFTDTSTVPPLGAFLIDEATYNAWFTGSPDDVCRNIGRRATEVEVQYLPDSLVQDYCDDVQQKNDHANGLVYQSLDKVYTVAELEAMDLWGQLSQKATELGYWCGGK